MTSAVVPIERRPAPPLPERIELWVRRIGFGAILWDVCRNS